MKNTRGEHKTLQDLDPKDSFTKKGFGLVGVVDLDLLSQIPQKYARIIGGGRGEGKLFKVNNGGE